MPVQMAGTRQRRLHVETQRVWFSRRHAPGAFGRPHRLGRTGIERHAIGITRPRPPGIARRHHDRDLGTALEAWIEQAQRVESSERGAVIVMVLGLPPHRLLPAQPEPGEVLVDGSFVFPPAASFVDILDTQQQPAAGGSRHRGIDERRQRMAKMQIAVGRGRETENGRHGYSIYRLAC